MIMELKISLFVLVPLLLATSGAHAGAAYSGPILPSITVSDAVGTNPGTVYTSGQAQRIVNVAWNAGSDYPYCEIYYTVNSANQTELGRGHDGTRPVTVDAGSTYAFWMVVYLGAQGQDVRRVTTLTVVAKLGNPPAPPPPSGGASIPVGSVDAVNDKPSDLNTKAYRNAPFIRDVQVRPDLRNVVISFSSTQSTSPLIEIGKVAPAPDRFGITTFPFNSGAFSRFAKPEGGRYVLDADAQGEPLDISTTYYYIINVFNNNKNDTKRPREQITGQFSTTLQTVKVVWEKIYMQDDSDDLSTCECRFWLWVNYGLEKGKSSVKYYYNSDMDTGHTYYVNKTLVINNVPDKLTIHASGRDDDSGAFTTNLDIVDPDYTPPIYGPGDAKNDDEQVNGVKEEYDLSKFSGDKPVNFRLETRGGDLKFVVFGHFEITRGTAEQIGTMSSPLKTGPEPVKAQGRVRPGGGPTFKSTLPICVAAREARERNSPAAPGLEEKCRSQEPVRAQGRVRRPEETPPRSPLPVCVAAQEARERNSPAARGLEEQCLAQQPVRALGRVRLPAGTTPSTPSSICDSAQRARQRNSPAARGLEETCLTIKKGEAIANEDPLAVELRNQQSDDSARQGFDIGMAAAEGNTLPGPGKDRICASLHTPAEQGGCSIAVLFSVERNRNAKLAATGAAIAGADPVVAEVRNGTTDVFYRLGFDIATGIYGDPALGAQANTAPGPIRDSLSAAGKNGFDASLKLHLSRNYRP